MFLQDDPVFVETIAATLGLEVCSFSLHTERNMEKPFKVVVKNCGSIAERHTGGLAGVMGMFARVSIS